MSLRILYAVHGYKPAYRVGGPIVSVAATAEELVRRGHHVTVFTTNANLDEELDIPVDRPIDVAGVEVWYFRRREYLQRLVPFVPYLSKSMGYLYAPRMRAELDRLVPTMDLVHTHMPYVYPTAAAGRAAWRHQKPLFYHQRGVFAPERLRFRGIKKRAYIAAVERPIMRRATTLIALTEAERDSYRALGVETTCRVVPNGVDAARYQSRPQVASHDFLGLPDSAFVILFMSRLHPTKGPDKLLEAFALIAREFPDTHLVLAGPDEYGLQHSLRARTEALGLSARVRFPGMVVGEDKRELLARADLFCLPSYAEGFSIVVLEAMASGTAVLLSPGCHFPEVETARAGHISSSDPSMLAGALRKLVATPGEVARMGRCGRDLMLRSYSWESVTDQLLAVYEEGIQRAPALSRR